MTDLVWTAPGEGDWWLVTEHFPYPVSRLFSSLFPPVTIGWKTGGARYGLPTGEARWAAVNGWIYYGPEIALTADELVQREEAAGVTLAASSATSTSNPWRDEVRRWHDEERPRAVEANRRLQLVDPAELGDAALTAHLRSTVANFLQSAPLHFEHAGFDIAAGLLLVAAADWDLDPTQLTGLLAGASPAGAAVDAHLRTITEALDRAGAATPVESLADVRRRAPSASSAPPRAQTAPTDPDRGGVPGAPRTSLSMARWRSLRPSATPSPSSRWRRW